nr:MAG TPA: hypothetical protein [Caudoviricetes sp.]
MIDRLFFLFVPKFLLFLVFLHTYRKIFISHVSGWKNSRYKAK